MGRVAVRNAPGTGAGETGSHPRPEVTMRRAAVGAWALWALALAGLGSVPWFDELMRRAGRPDLTQLNASTIPYLVAIVVAATVGAVVAGRLPRHPVGWLLLGVGLSVAASGVADGYARYGLVARPGALPLARWVAIYSPATTVVGLALVGFVLLLTPTGSLPSRRWRWWAVLAAAAPVLFVVVLPLGPGLVIPPYQAAVGRVGIPALAGVVLAGIAAGFFGTVAGLLVGAGSLVARFRRARGAERQQLRWLALAAALTGLGAAVVGVGMALDATAVPLFAAGVCLALLPLATGAAILRYRLYDLDRIISRTLAYGLLTVLLGGGYAAVVLGLGRLIGQDSSLVVAAATLAVAAAFQPARRRIQAAVDRRFDRRRYDAAQTIAGFGDRLRQQVDLDTLAVELVAVVGETMQPASVSLWLRPFPARPRDA
jgi:hypothetical protein